MGEIIPQPSPPDSGCLWPEVFPSCLFFMNMGNPFSDTEPCAGLQPTVKVIEGKGRYDLTEGPCYVLLHF